MTLDHVLVAVRDLETGARELEDAYGLRSVGGGRHPGWGTANRIVSLGDAYLELVAVVDPAEASGSAFGRWVAAAAETPLRPFGWAVRTDDLEAVVTRLGLAAAAGSRVREDGTVVRWRVAGVERAAAEPSVPFFIEWGEGTSLPGRASDSPRGRIECVRLRGEETSLVEWLGSSGEVPYVMRPGRPAVLGVDVATSSGDLVSIGA